MELPYERQFHFRDGSSARSLDDLAAKVGAMSYEEFYRHVDGKKNDFANWIRYVLRDAHLADDLQKVTSIVETIEIINDYLRPRPRGDDVQSRIETEVFHLDLPPPALPVIDEPVAEELAHEFEKERATIERDGYEPLSMPEEAPRIELEAMGEKDRSEGVPRERPQERPEAILRDRPPEWHEFHNDVGRMIVKDFLLGMLLGLVLGFLLGRMFSLM